MGLFRIGLEQGWIWDWIVLGRVEECENGKDRRGYHLEIRWSAKNVPDGRRMDIGLVKLG